MNKPTLRLPPHSEEWGEQTHRLGIFVNALHQRLGLPGLKTEGWKGAGNQLDPLSDAVNVLRQEVGLPSSLTCYEANYPAVINKIAQILEEALPALSKRMPGEEKEVPDTKVPPVSDPPKELWFVKKGSWYIFNDGHKVQGEDNAAEYLAKATDE